MPHYIRHRPQITHAIEDTPEGESVVYRVRCCDLQGPYYFRYRDAEVDLEQHLAAVAPPQDKTCREPKKHRSKPHDWCALCIDQEPLPGFDHLTATK